MSRIYNLYLVPFMNDIYNCIFDTFHERYQIYNLYMIHFMKGIKYTIVYLIHFMNEYIQYKLYIRLS